jgi:regulator of sigma E protease
MPLPPVPSFLDILLLIVILMPLVAFHELGHYLFARLFKMDVEEFAVGMGRPKWTLFKRNGTEYTLRALPLGGFVRIKGMMPEQDGSETQIPNGFYSKPAWQRFLVLFAGPIFSVLGGYLVFLGVFFSAGTFKAMNVPVLGTIVEKEAAWKANLKENDKVLSIDGMPVNTFYDIVKIVRVSGEKPLTFKVQRGSEVLDIVATPETGKEPTPLMDENLEITDNLAIQAKLGVAPTLKNERGIGIAFNAANQTMVQNFNAIANLFRKIDELPSKVTGPVGMAGATAYARNEGPLTVFFLAGLLSFSLGIMNLLPIVPFDGGQMMVAAVEILRGGRRISYKMQGSLAGLGLAFILLMFAFVFTMDIGRLKKSLERQSNSGQPSQTETAPKK